MSAHNARLHALAAALCALLLLVALGLMDANGAPWWALLATQGALLVATVSAGIWLDRAAGRRRPGDEALRGAFTVTGTARYHLPGVDGRVLRAGDGGPRSTERAFWMERAPGRVEEEER